MTCKVSSFPRGAKNEDELFMKYHENEGSLAYGEKVFNNFTKAIRIELKENSAIEGFSTNSKISGLKKFIDYINKDNEKLASESIIYNIELLPDNNPLLRSFKDRISSYDEYKEVKDLYNEGTEDEIKKVAMFRAIKNYLNNNNEDSFIDNWLTLTKNYFNSVVDDNIREAAIEGYYKYQDLILSENPDIISTIDEPDYIPEYIDPVEQLEKNLKKIRNHWLDQIKNLRNIAEVDPSKIEEVQREIVFISTQTEKLLENNSFKVVYNTAITQLRRVEKLLDKDNLSITDLQKAYTFVRGWDSAVSLFNYREGENKELLGEIIKQVAFLTEELDIKSREYFLNQQLIPGTSELDFRPTKDINLFEAYTLDSSISTSKIEQSLDKIIRENNFIITSETEQERKRIDSLIEPLKKKYGKNWQDKFIQKNDKGEKTPYMQSKYSYKYYELIKDKANAIDVAETKDKDKAVSEYYNTLYENSDIYNPTDILENKEVNLTEEEISKARELLDKFEEDKNNFIEETKEYIQHEHLTDEGIVNEQTLNAAVKDLTNRWVKYNSPFVKYDLENKARKGNIDKLLFKNRGHIYLLPPKPKDKFINNEYDKLIEDEDAKKFLDYYYNSIDEYVSNYENGFLNYLYLPDANKGLREHFIENGAKGLFKYSTKEIADFISVDHYSDVEYGVIDEQTGKAIRRLPKNIINRGLAIEHKSFDIEKSLKRFVAQGISTRNKLEIEDDVILINRILQNLEEQVTNPDGNAKKYWNGDSLTLRNGLKNIKNRSDYLTDTFYNIRKRLEGVGKKQEKGVLKDRRLVVSKVVDSTIQFTQAKALGLNVFSGATNLFFGLTSNISHAAQGLEYTDNQYFKGLSIILKAISPFKKQGREKIATLMAKYQVLAEINPMNVGGKSIFDKAFFLQKLGEYFNQGNLLISMMLNTEIIDNEGNKTNLWEAYDNKGKLKPEFSESGYGDIVTDRGIELLSDSNMKFANKIQQTTKILHGNYDPFSSTKIKSTYWGRLLMVFRTWIPNTYYNRLGKSYYDNRLGRTKKGRWVSYGTLAKEGFWKPFIVLAKLSIFGKAINEDLSQYSKVDIANMKENLREIYMASALLVLTLMLAKLKVEDDDGEEQKVLSFFLRSAERVESDLWFFASPSAFTEIVKNPLPVLSTVTDLFSIFPAVVRAIQGEDEIEYGRNSGMSNLASRFR